LGGDVDGDLSTPPATAPPMVTGKADGFQNVQLNVIRGGGTIVIANNKGATIYPVLKPDGTKATGATYSVEVFVNNIDPANQIGSTMTLNSINGRFSLSGAQIVPGVAPGAVATLIARAWDNTTGATYDSAFIKGSTTFKSDALGGDVDGDPSTPPATATAMVTGRADGFQNIQLQGGIAIPEPSTITLGALGAAALLLRRRK
jgi:hypothetical protein